MQPSPSFDDNLLNISLSSKESEETISHLLKGVKHLYPVSRARNKRTINARISRALIRHRQRSLRAVSHQLLKRRKIEKSMDPHLDREHHYHDATEHGIVYRSLNEMLHLIVLIYALYGLIRFEVKFIRMKRLVKFISYALITHNWYLSIKFAIIAFVGYFLNLELSMRNLSWEQFNCTKPDYNKIFANTSIQQDDYFSHVMKNFDSMFTGFSPIAWNDLLVTVYENIGGPYRVLGNRATMMYGFYSISIYIMLSIFPLELFSLKVAFNYTRFVLNDLSCMDKFLDDRQDYLDAISAWSRVSSDSHITHSINNTTSQRELRCRYVTDFDTTGNLSNNEQIDDAEDAPQEEISKCPFKRLWRGIQRSSLGQIVQHPLRYINFKAKSDCSIKLDLAETTVTRKKYSVLNVEGYLTAPNKSLLHHMATNQGAEPDYNVKVANKNLMNFIPYVRSKDWFKYSMKLYSIFIFLTFTDVVIVIASISDYVKTALVGMEQDCEKRTNQTANLCTNWSHWDSLLYYETDYQIFALSCATSFYSSYYFGTILELNIWMQELSQQLDLCERLVTITGDALRVHYNPEHQIGQSDWFHYQENVQHVLRDINYLDNNTINIDNLCNEFGGIKSIETLYAFKCSPFSVRNKIREIVAVNLLDRKQTVLRATYVNLQLFLSELKATEFISRLILGRTVRLTIGFATFASLTRSQLEASYMNLTFLLAVCLAILNVYLIGAASVNTSVSWLQ